MSRLSERLFFFVLALIVLCWGGYHFYRYYHDPLQFETVFEYTVPQTLTGTGIAIRDESLIDESPSGIESYLFDDAARVAVGEVIAEYYLDNAGDRNIRRLREIEKEIRMLEDAQNTNVNNLANADAINRDIRDKLGIIADIASTGECGELSQTRSELISLVNRRQIAVGRTEDYSERISVLQEEYAHLNASTGTSAIQTATAPTTGFFSKQYDGFESLISPASLDKLSIEEYVELTTREPPRIASGKVGRMVTNQVWYYALPIPINESEWLQKDQLVELWFEQVGFRIPAKVYDIKFENNNDTMIAIFQSNYISSEIINLRVGEVTVYSSQHTGLRIPAPALYFRENPRGEIERGVYVLDGNTVRFKLIYPIYEDQSFLLSDLNPPLPVVPEEDMTEYQTPEAADYNMPPAVKQFDLVITKGIDLYDGKPIQ